MDNNLVLVVEILLLKCTESPYKPRIKEAAVHNAAPIKYEEIGLMNTMYNSGGPSNKPTDYNSGLQ